MVAPLCRTPWSGRVALLSDCRIMALALHLRRWCGGTQVIAQCTNEAAKGASTGDLALKLSTRVFFLWLICTASPG